MLPAGLLDLLHDHWPGETLPPLAIHPDDEMLRRDVWNPDAALVEYFHTGLLAARTLAPILSWQRERLDRPLTVLDFASGYGRVTRFLAAGSTEEDIWVSEVEPAAVEFQRQALGLQGFPSSVVPEEIAVPPDAPSGFDLVLVASLFSHLPATTFQRWLARIADFLSPEGVLAFSVMDEAVLPGVFSMPDSGPASGLSFEPASELEHRLDVQSYGRSWVTEDFVLRTLAEVFSPEVLAAHPPCRIPRALWHYQDLWLVSAGADVRPLAERIDGGPDGRISAVALQPEGSPHFELVRLEGWAVHPTEPDRALSVEVWREGKLLASVAPETPRLDVVQHFVGHGEWRAGWGLDLEATEHGLDLHTPVLIKAVDSKGLSQVLHLGSLESLLADQRLREVEAELASCREDLDGARDEALTVREELARAEHRAEVFERSGFGLLRRRWMHLKRRLSGS